MGSRDGRQFSIEHARESEQIVALVLQRNAHRAKPSHAPGLATHKLHDDEVEQHLPRGQTDHIDWEDAPTLGWHTIAIPFQKMLNAVASIDRADRDIKQLLDGRIKFQTYVVRR
jgi:hypothetical protein